MTRCPANEIIVDILNVFIETCQQGESFQIVKNVAIRKAIM